MRGCLWISIGVLTLIIFFGCSSPSVLEDIQSDEMNTQIELHEPTVPLSEAEQIERSSSLLQDDLISEKADLKQEQLSESELYQEADRKGPSYQYLYSDLYAEYPESFIVQENTVYLTFDDGPTWLTGQYLDVLADYGVKATFFVVGKDQNTEVGRERLQRIYQEGHTIGVHCHLHDYDVIYASVEDYLDDFYQIYSFVFEVTGEAPVIFRFPGGSSKLKQYGLRDEIIDEMTRRGFVCYDWSISTADTAVNATTETCIKNVVDYCGADRRNIVLAHDGKAFVLEALPKIIETLQKKDYIFAPLTPCIEPVLFN